MYVQKVKHEERYMLIYIRLLCRRNSTSRFCRKTKIFLSKSKNLSVIIICHTKNILRKCLLYSDKMFKLKRVSAINEPNIYLSSIFTFSAYICIWIRYEVFLDNMLYPENRKKYTQKWMR